MVHVSWTLRIFVCQLIEEAIEEKYRLELGIILLNGLGHALVTLGCSSYNNTA